MKNLKKIIPPVKKPRLSGWLLTADCCASARHHRSGLTPATADCGLQAVAHHARCGMFTACLHGLISLRQHMNN